MHADLLELKDIHLPSPIAMWQIAPGWILLLVLFLTTISYFIYFFYKCYKKKKIIRFALKKLNHLKTTNALDRNIAAELSTFIRRTALCYFNREDIAGLAGTDWLEFLNRSGNTTRFTEKIGQLLIDEPFRKKSIADLTHLFDLTEHWLIALSKHHETKIQRKEKS